jgi:hypothetical protein
MPRSRLLTLLASALVLLAIPVSASASCGNDVLQSAAKSSLTLWYSPGCYKQATRLLTPDLRQYSDAPDEINAAARRDRLRKLKVSVAKTAPGGKVKISFSPAVGAIRVSVFAKKNGRFVASAIGTLQSKGGTLKARLGKATRIRVSAGYPGSGDKPFTVSLTLKR